jgi:hypothetical protein
MPKSKPLSRSRTFGFIEIDGGRTEIEARSREEAAAIYARLLAERERSRWKMFNFARHYGAGPKTLQRMLTANYADIERRIYKRFLSLGLRPGIHDELIANPPYQIGRESRIFAKREGYGVAVHPSFTGRFPTVPFLWNHNPTLSLDTETLGASLMFNDSKPRKTETIIRELRKAKREHNAAGEKRYAAQDALRAAEKAEREAGDRVFLLKSELNDAIV